MKVFLTGATGYLGSAVLDRLRADGHEVTAHARSPESAGKLPDGVTAAVGDVTELKWMYEQLAPMEGLIHCASPMDETTGDFETAFLSAALPAIGDGGNQRPFVYTAGTWVHGSGQMIDEDAPFDPPAIVAWRPPFVKRVRAAASQGIRTVVVGPANLYGAGGGIPEMLAQGPTPGGRLLIVGSGRQHVPNVHRDDIAALYALALTDGPPGSYFLGASDRAPSMAELMQVASRARGLEGRMQAESLESSQKRLGPLVGAMALDAQIDCARARALGWTPTGRPLIDELAAAAGA